MEKPSKLEEDFEALATEMVALKYFSGRVMRKEPKRMDGWLDRIESAMTDFIEIRREMKEVDPFNNSEAHVKLGRRASESLKVATELTDKIESIMEPIETSSNAAKTDEPKTEVATPFKNENEKSLTAGEGDKTKISKPDEDPKKQNSEITKNPSLQQTNARPESTEKLHELSTDKSRRFSHKDILKFTSNLSTELGSGAFGNVYKGQFNGVEVAVKILPGNENFIDKEFMAEVSTMGRTDHHNLVKFYGFSFDYSMHALVYEYVSNGSLDQVLFENRFDLQWEKLYDIAVDIAKALVYLHDNEIIHHDLKPANVLLDLKFSPKITDFGLANLMSGNGDHPSIYRLRGTVGYGAPETFMPFSKITSKCDVYSYGMMLFEIFKRGRNVTKETWFPKRVWEKFESGRLDELIEECGITVENKEKARILCVIALWCIQFTPEARPSMDMVSTMLEKEIRVTRPPNPIFQSLSISSMQPSQFSQEIIYSKITSSTEKITMRVRKGEHYNGDD